MRRLIVGLVLLAGCGQSPKYCDDCRAIRELQAKASKTTEDYAKLDELKKAYSEKAKSLAGFDDLAGKMRDLHPDCDCPCHLHAR
jgi:outer membrane murein-binding lipoprotein Lpp